MKIQRNLNKNYLLYFIVTFLQIQSSCISNQESQKKYSDLYNYKNLQNAWFNHDTIFLKQWVMGYQELDFNLFVSKHNDLANSFNFCYGYLDETVDQKKIIPIDQQYIIKYNVTIVYLEYLKSCLLFNNKVKFDSTLYIQDKIWKVNSLIDSNDIIYLRKQFENKCKTQAEEGISEE